MGGLFNLTNMSQHPSVVQAFTQLNGFLPNKYLQAAVLLLAVYVLSRILIKIIKVVTLFVTRNTKTDVDDKIADATEGPISWIMITIGARIAFIPLEFGGGQVSWVSHALNTATIILIAVMAIRVSDILITNWGGKWAKKTKSTIDDALLPIFHRASKVSLSILALFFVMSEWSIDLTGVLAGLGIAGLALGFAVKDSLSNIFGGISLILDKAIQVGDYIELGDISGEVVDVGLRSTRVRTWDNDMLIIPNGNLANSQFKNYKLPDLKSRFTVNFGVEYGTNPDKVKDLVIALIKKNKKIIKDPAPFVRFQDMGDSALNFTAYCWVENLSDKWSTREKLTTDIYNELNKKKIGIPFPTRTIYTKKG